MPKRIAPECIEDAFELYLKYNGERHDLIEREMRLKGWSSFHKQCLTNRGIGENFREGWVERFGWKKNIEIYLKAKINGSLTREEKLFAEVENIRQKIYDRIETNGVDNRDLVWQHDKYAARSMEILAQIENAKSVSRDFASFLTFLISISISISPVLARELVNAEDAIIRRAKDEFDKK